MWFHFNETFSILILDDFILIPCFVTMHAGKSLTRDGAAEVLEEHGVSVMVGQGSRHPQVVETHCYMVYWKRTSLMFHSLFSECWPCKLMFCQSCCLSSSWNRDSAIFILQKWFNVIYTVLSLAVFQQPLPKFYYNDILSSSMILWSLDKYIYICVHCTCYRHLSYHISVPSYCPCPCVRCSMALKSGLDGSLHCSRFCATSR